MVVPEKNDAKTEVFSGVPEERGSLPEVLDVTYCAPSTTLA